MQYMWRKLLARLIDLQSVFSNAFEIKDNNLCFKDEVSEDDRLSARKIAFEK